MTEFDCDVAVFGGGIAGLWAMQALEARGYAPVLIERHTLGGAQTLASQGILHGGIKYALDGRVDDIALRLREMPQRWLQSIRGGGEVDLSGVGVLSDRQHLWSSGSILSKLSGALGAKMLHGEVDAESRDRWPAVFQETGYRGTVRVLHETVLDIKSVVEKFAANLQGRHFRAQGIDLQMNRGRIDGVKLHASNCQPCLLRAGFYVFAAGVGNEGAAQHMEFPQPATQRRPLRQMLVKGVPWKLYGHCLMADPKPRVTVTTHFLPDGTPVWYLGGNIAEKACKMSEEEAFDFALREMMAVFPKIDWKRHEWASWDVDRAEPHQAVRFMPGEPTVQIRENSVLAWPTKLVFAPALASKLAQEIGNRLSPGGASAPALTLPAAEVGKYPWEQATWRTLT
ncbi:MAG: FAD-dependent oxidoreductase [Verrucomicrobiales bacterium]|nr:FAD-dependent oxidoreductase [Verrucomicrobiales bacterium]